MWNGWKIVFFCIRHSSKQSTLHSFYTLAGETNKPIIIIPLINTPDSAPPPLSSDANTWNFCLRSEWCFCEYCREWIWVWQKCYVCCVMFAQIKSSTTTMTSTHLTLYRLDYFMLIASCQCKLTLTHHHRVRVWGEEESNSSSSKPA
jgi:hypothetical protein